MWNEQARVGAFVNLDLSRAMSYGPDGYCTTVHPTKRLDHMLEVKSDGILILNGYMATGGGDSIGAICLRVNGERCGAQSIYSDRASGTASCTVAVSKGDVRVSIIAASRDIADFKASYALLPR